ncbi:MAG: DUF2634 domain-containing protein [Candidatus Desantisbacteria bacterium]
MNEKELFGKDMEIVDIYPRKDLTAIDSVHQKKDFGTVENRDNLAQALTLRLITPVGMLSNLGHSSYGSRLYELIGQLNNPTNRKLVELYAKEAILQDPRVKEITKITVETLDYKNGQVDIHIALIPIETQMPLNFVVPFYFE